MEDYIESTIEEMDAALRVLCEFERAFDVTEIKSVYEEDADTYMRRTYKL